MYRITCLISGCAVLVGCEDGVTPNPVDHEWQAVLSAETGWEGLVGTAIVQATGTGLGFVATT
jgi:hypothetical protein